MTTSSMILIGFVVVAVLMALEMFWKSWRSGRVFCIPLPRPYRDRESREDAWRQRCSDEAMERADAVLTILCNAFTFNSEKRYQFAPSDRIMDIYRSLYPRWKFWLACDSMEIESLLMDLKKEVGFDITKWHQDITAGEIVDVIVAM